MFGLKKKEKKETKKQMSTLEEVRKAYQDLSDDDKKKFHQSISDRIHESIAAQERDSGTEDSQTAEDREHEALGAEHADDRREEEKIEKMSDEEKGIRYEEHKDVDRYKMEEDEDFRKMIGERLDAIESMLSELAKDPLEEKKEKYGLSAKPFRSDEKKYSPADIRRMIG